MNLYGNNVLFHRAVTDLKYCNPCLAGGDNRSKGSYFSERVEVQVG